jgi:hypothetical protein
MWPRVTIPTCACLAAAALAVSACTLTTSFDGLTGGPCATGCADGGLDGAADAGADAWFEATADLPPDDAADDGDATGDGNAGGDAGSLWCASQDAGYLLCSDFDRPGESVTQGFDLGLMQVPNSGGTFQLDPSSFVSPPNAAVGRANSYGASGSGGAFLHGSLWPLGAAPATLDCSVQWSPVELSPAANDWAHIVALSVYSDAATQNEVFDLNVKLLSDGTLALDEIYQGSGPGQSVRHILPISIATGQWYSVHMSLTNGAGGTSYAVTVGGVQAPGGTLMHPLPASSHGTFRTGPAYYQGANTTPSPGWTFRYDDVICY